MLISHSVTDRPMRIIDVFAGTGSSTQAFYDAGHEIVYVELIPKLCEELRRTHPRAIVLNMDAKTFAKDPWRYLPTSWREGGVDVVWLSPPCTAYSPAGKASRKKDSTKNAVRPRWLFADNPEHVALIPQERARLHAQVNERVPFFGPRFPNDPTARLGVGLALASLEIVRKVSPTYWWMENPMGGLITMEFMEMRAPPPVIVTHCQYELELPPDERRMKATALWGKWPEGWTPRPKCKNGAPCHIPSPRGSRTGTQGLKNAKLRSKIPYALGADIMNAVA